MNCTIDFLVSGDAISEPNWRVTQSISGDEEKKLKNCQKSNHESMVSFKNSFNRQKQSWRQHFYQDEYDFKIKIFYDSSSLMDLNQQLKFDENE